MSRLKATPVIYSPETYRTDDSVAYMMKQIIHFAGLEIEQLLGPSDLTNAQWVPLHMLHSGKASTPAELARVCRLDAGAMTRTLDRLENKGLCQRQRSEEDRRVIHIALTEAGTNAAEGIPSILCQVHNAHLEGFSREEFDQLKSYLRRILTNAKKHADASQLCAQEDTASPKAN